MNKVAWRAGCVHFTGDVVVEERGAGYERGSESSACNSVPNEAAWNDRHEQARFRPDVIRSLLSRYNCILKFVIDEPQDVAEVQVWLSHFADIDPGFVWLMPQARSREQLAERSSWLRDLAAEHGFNFSSRLHIEQFGNVRGT